MRRPGRGVVARRPVAAQPGPRDGPPSPARHPRSFPAPPVRSSVAQRERVAWPRLVGAGGRAPPAAGIVQPSPAAARARGAPAAKDTGTAKPVRTASVDGSTLVTCLPRPPRHRTRPRPGFAHGQHLPASRPGITPGAAPRYFSRRCAPGSYPAPRRVFRPGTAPGPSPAAADRCLSGTRVGTAARTAPRRTAKRPGPEPCPAGAASRRCNAHTPRPPPAGPP